LQEQSSESEKRRLLFSVFEIKTQREREDGEAFAAMANGYCLKWDYEIAPIVSWMSGQGYFGYKGYQMF